MIVFISHRNNTPYCAVYERKINNKNNCYLQGKKNSIIPKEKHTIADRIQLNK